MFEQLLKLRYLAVLVVLLAIVHALTFLFLGLQIAAATYRHVWVGGEAAGARPGVELLHSLDLVLVALVLMIFALGIAKLFLLQPGKTDPRTAGLPSWLEIESFGDLKRLLWETILFALLIISLSNLTAGLIENLTWSALIIPAAILMLALSLFLMRKD
jgi:uncharacterized membrane protein YqhA